VRGKVREEDGGIRKGSMDFGGIHFWSGFHSFRVFTRGDFGGSLGGLI
jgi:hypothetical protein